MALHLDFVAVGPQRTATSWLDATLRTHKGVALPAQVKETYFFEDHFERGFAWYAAHFENVGHGAVVGEVASTLFDVPEGPHRIREVSPRCKIVVTLRDPVERTVSLYRHHLSKGRVSGSFSAAVRQMPRIVESGRYSVHVPRWLDAFGSEQVLFLLLDDIESCPQRVLDDICRFLDVSPIPLPELASDRIGSAKIRPQFPLLAKAAARAAHEFRSRGLHSYVEFGKRLGIKRAAFAGKTQAPGLASDEETALRDTYAKDIEFVRSLLGRELVEWGLPGDFGRRT